MKLPLTLTLCLLGSIACFAQTTTVNFVLPISTNTMAAITNAWLTHQAAVTLDPTNYGGRAVTRELMVTNEATGEGYMTNRVTWAKPRMSFAAFRSLVAERMRMEQQLAESAERIRLSAASFISPPIVATNSPDN